MTGIRTLLACAGLMIVGFMPAVAVAEPSLVTALLSGYAAMGVVCAVLFRQSLKYSDEKDAIQAAQIAKLEAANKVCEEDRKALWERLYEQEQERNRDSTVG